MLITKKITPILKIKTLFKVLFKIKILNVFNGEKKNYKTFYFK